MAKTVNEIKQKTSNVLVLTWQYDKCAGRMESAFARLTRHVGQEGAVKVVLDMSRCEYLSIAGMNSLLEWYLDLARDGIEVRITGLRPILRSLFVMSKLDWILAEN